MFEHNWSQDLEGHKNICFQSKKSERDYKLELLYKVFQNADDAVNKGFYCL